MNQSLESTNILSTDVKLIILHKKYFYIWKVKNIFLTNTFI